PPPPELRRDTPESFRDWREGDYAPASASNSEARLCGFYLHAFGFGGKGIRTPGLLIANETLYQLSYTPLDGERKLSRCENLSAREKTAESASCVSAADGSRRAGAR